ncbi:MAG: VCBS repeat-containing protein [Planctomycetes bacterium]|nr:VCBS repeat-containing protein [Planctomycetota bacterium]
MVQRAAPWFFLATALLVGGCHKDEDRQRPVIFDPSDVDADGWADIVVGAPGSGGGSVYVYRGPDRSLMTVLLGTEDNSRFGGSAAAIGDFNGDGRPDLAVGAPLDDGDDNATDEGTDVGRVFIYLGGASFGTPALTLTGAEVGGQFGFSVARAGDVNGDGFDDVIVGAPFENGGGTGRGRAHLFLGGVAPSPAPALTFTGGEDMSRFGFSVSTAGDLNGDGFFDWMIGAPMDDGDATVTDEGTDRGRVFIYLGSSSPNNNLDVVINGAEVGAQLGYSVAGLLDVDGDALGDILLGAPFDDGDGDPLTNGDDFGAAYFIFGDALRGVISLSSLYAVASRIFVGTERDAQFGAFVGRLGDINSGGAPDLFIGAPLDDGDGNDLDEGTDVGRGFVFFGGPLIDTVADVVVTGAEPGGQFGFFAASGGDVDGDGHRDFWVAAPGDDVDANPLTDSMLERGKVFFYRGGPALDALDDGTLTGGLEDGAALGSSGA